MCRVLEVSPSGYCAWRSRKRSTRKSEDEKLQLRVKAIHTVSRQTYGVPRIHAELKAEGTAIGRKRVARLMKASALVGVTRRKRTITTRRDRSAQSAPDLIDRQFVAAGPNQVWVADITYIPTWIGFLYLAVVLDVWSRKTVGWAMESHLRASRITGAFDGPLSNAHRPTASCITPIRAVSTPRSSLVNDAERATIDGIGRHCYDTQCARASLQRSTASLIDRIPSKIATKPAPRSSTSLKVALAYE